VTAAAPVRASRDAYRDVLGRLLEEDERIWCLDSDTGLFDRSWLAGRARYLNLGIAEQNLLGVAAGLAAAGARPFVTTMAVFASLRALEFVKVDIAVPGLPVRIVATHGGLAAGHLGPTHHALEDLAIMRVLPNMTVVVPADAAATEALIRQACDLPGPVYLRLGRKPTPACGAGEAARLGRAHVLHEGSDVTIAACGAVPVLRALAASERLRQAGIGARVLDLHTVRPLDVDALVRAAAETAGIVTVEDHSASGGLGSAVAEVVAEHQPARVVRIGVAEVPQWDAGDHEALLDRRGVTERAIAGAARDVTRKAKVPHGR
jgi:transketolase